MASEAPPAPMRMSLDAVELQASLARWFGYTAGAADLFRVLERAAAGHEPPAFMSTHPATAERIARMREAETPGPLLPLPAEIAAFLAAGPPKE